MPEKPICSSFSIPNTLALDGGALGPMMANMCQVSMELRVKDVLAQVGRCYEKAIFP